MKNPILPLLFSFTVLTLQAQRPSDSTRNPKDREAMKAKMDLLHTAFLTEGLELTSSEAKLFWPIWEQGKEAINRTQDSIQSIQKATKQKALTAIDSDQSLQTYLELSMHKVELLNEELLDLAKIIGSQRAMRIPSLEREFRLRMVKAREQRLSPETRKAFDEMGRAQKK
tara:strand:+ start:2155 stop:2664 length:510 start_codon:yes stop_codon:yes gene_type:complete